jgi:hypothetical protein
MLSRAEQSYYCRNNEYFRISFRPATTIRHNDLSAPNAPESADPRFDQPLHCQFWPGKLRFALAGLTAINRKMDEKFRKIAGFFAANDSFTILEDSDLLIRGVT